MEKNKELNKKLQDLVCTEMRDNLIEILKKQPYKTLFTDIDGYDRIYSYYYGANDELVEKQVKGIQLSEDGEIWVCLDVTYIEYDMEFLLSSESDDYWYPLFGGEILSWFTIININEVLHEYLDQE